MNLIPCACGCGQQRKEFDPQGRPAKYIRGHYTKGKKCPEISERQRGINNHMWGKVSPLRGVPRPDLRGENSNAWRGGSKLRYARSHAKRKQFGFIPLNDCSIDGWVGHHLDLNYVIFIPEELHKSVFHSIIKNINMDIINDKVYEWFIEYYGLI